MTDDRQWRTVCVSYYDHEATDDLILDAVRPLFAELKAAGDPAYFLRHWRRGPHLRLNVGTTAEDLRDRILPAVERWVGTHLRARPSTVTIDFDRMAAAHRRLAAVEQDHGPLRPLRRDNVIEVEPYDDRAHVLGGPAAAAFLAAFHIAATPAAFTALEAIRAGEQRLGVAFELMAATAHAFSGGGLRLGYVSFRAHAEIYLARHHDPERLRVEWDRVSRVARPDLRARLQRVTDGEGQEWLDVLRTVRDRGFELVDSGGMPMTMVSPEEEPASRTTPFLRSLLQSQRHDRMMASSPFRHYRLLLNLLYVQLTRLGIRPDERGLLGHLLADTVEDTYGIDAAALLSTIRA